MIRGAHLPHARRLQRGIAALTLAAIAASMPTGTVRALCAKAPPLDEHLDAADVIFVGVVRAIANLDRTATFAVLEQWKGEPLAPQVVVHGGEDNPNAMSTADRTFDLGARYLVAATGNLRKLRDNSCSATRPWTDDLALLRPADAVRFPQDVESHGEPAGAGLPRELVVVGVAGIVLAVVAALAFLRPRRSGRA